ncbi:cytochrome-c peroxidase [Kaarinaea lacus]
MEKIIFSRLIFSVVFSTMMGVVQAADLTEEQKLGSLLYSDTSLSLNGNQSCATCHSLKKVELADEFRFPAPGFVDPVNVTTRSVTSEGSIAGLFGGLNAPSVGYAAFSPEFFFDETEGLWIGGQFWNGRAATLEEQAKGPFLNPVEMAMPSRWAVISVIKEKDRYVRLFNRVYGFDLTAVPSNPMASSDDDAPLSVYEAYDLMASAIANFERSSVFNKFTSKFDAVEAGKATYTALEQTGKDLFEGKAQCVLCHVMDPATGPDGKIYPPVFTDFSYDNIGVPRATSIPGNPAPDLGLGATTGDPGDNGKHKVMSLRNIELTAPYGHNGYFRTLEHIVHFYNTRDVTEKGWAPPEIPENVNFDELGNLGLTHEEELAIVAFLKTLTDGYYDE